MRSFLLIITIALLSSCSTNRGLKKSYYFVEPFLEQEMKILLKKDMHFVLRDRIGCNQFEYKGTYRVMEGISGWKQVVFDSLQFHKEFPVLSDNRIFQLKSLDTALYYNSDRLLINTKSFKATSWRTGNLQNIRYRKIKTFYTDLMGRSYYKEAFGRGKGMLAARKNILTCTLPCMHFIIDSTYHQPLKIIPAKISVLVDSFGQVRPPINSLKSCPNCIF